jgi:riboflavin biosynthesis pyrimidine reductase
MRIQPFESFVEEKTRRAVTASIARLSTIVDRRDAARAAGIGNAWSRLHYDGDFGLVHPAAGETALSLVFVQSRDGNTGADDPATLGGGATDLHLIYEGLSRVAADAVLAGARTVHADAFFSVWHPQLVALRRELGLPRHPAQIVISKRGHVDFNARMFNVPDVHVFLIGDSSGMARHASSLRARPWVRHIPLSGDDLSSAIDYLREAGIRRISAVGGRSTASGLVDAGLAQDLYLTTTAHDGGEPGTPWYTGVTPPRLDVVTRKDWRDDGGAVVFEHLLIARPNGPS